MLMTARLLFISNGYGEDIIGAYIAKKIHTMYPYLTVAAFPTVGRGAFYVKMGIKSAGRGTELPSEGFVRSLKEFFRDVKNGFFSKTLHMGLSLRNASKGFDFLIIVGDPYLLFFTSLFTRIKKDKKIFVGVQQSEWYGSRKAFKQHYSAIERVWLRRFAGLIYVRDYKTMEFLRGKRLFSVRCSGNPMMDCFNIHERHVLPGGRKIIGILPGSKQEAYENLTLVFDIITALSVKGEEFIYAIALSPQLDAVKIQHMFGLLPLGTEYLNTEELYTIYRYEKTGNRIIISKKAFGDIINESDAVIGLSGTGNEQAAGLGTPVFASWGKGPQITKKFMRAQKKLLGPSLFLYPPDPEMIAQGIIETLGNKALLKNAAENGRMRMRGRGSIEIMAREIYEYIQSVRQCFR